MKILMLLQQVSGDTHSLADSFTSSNPFQDQTQSAGLHFMCINLCAQCLYTVYFHKFSFHASAILKISIFGTWAAYQDAAWQLRRTLCF